jgi:hypothetical protein
MLTERSRLVAATSVIYYISEQWVKYKLVKTTHQINSELAINATHFEACRQFREDLTQTWVVMKNVLVTSTVNNSSDITLVTHGSSNRINTLTLLLDYWQGTVPLLHCTSRFHNKYQ